MNQKFLPFKLFHIERKKTGKPGLAVALELFGTVSCPQVPLSPGPLQVPAVPRTFMLGW